MEIQGKVWKEGKFWFIEVPMLDIMTQGTTRKEALSMAEDAVLELMISYFKENASKDFSVTCLDYSKNDIAITANDINLLTAFSLRRQREMSGSTLKEAAKRLGVSSLNSYAQYEKGKTNISIKQYEDLLEAANPHKGFRLRVV